MKASSAIGLVLAGVGLLMRRDMEGSSPWRSSTRPP